MLPLLLLGLCAAQNPFTDHTQLYKVIERQFEYPGSLKSIRSVNFRELDTVILVDGKGSDLRFPMRNGKAVRRDRYGEETLTLTDVRIVDTPEKAAEIAIVTHHYLGISGSSCGNAFIQVFHLLNGKLMLLQQIDYGNRGKPGMQFDWKRGHLRLTAVHPCDSNTWSFKLDVTFRWNGSKFERTAVREIPTPNGSW